MGSVWRRHRAKFLLLAFYAVTIPGFLYFGFHAVGTNAAAVYAEEAAVATELLKIPSIGLSAPVMESTLENRQFSVPSQIAGIYRSGKHKIFIMGHSATIFSGLTGVQIGDQVWLDGTQYTISNIEIRQKQDIDMSAILADTREDTVILMTCFGESLGGQDYTHRLIVTAQ